MIASLEINRARVLGFRWRASHLDHRLPETSIERAAYAGLQDSAPRAAVISLHARVEDVTPSSWEHPSLCQIWGPRGADYVIARRDLAPFTLGRMPRDADAAAAIERTADSVLAVCDGHARPTGEVADALPDLGHQLRLTSITGRVLIRWDASTISVIPVERPDMDIEDARLELARRFLAWFAPATVKRYAWWAGIDDDDARQTWTALQPELLDVNLEGDQRSMLRAHEEAMRAGDAVRCVRLLPHGDPYLKMDGEIVVPDPQRRPEVFPVPRVKTAFWPVSGGVVVDGEVVGAWARQRRRVTVHPWGPIDPSSREAIEREALAFPIASSSRAEVLWT